MLNEQMAYEHMTNNEVNLHYLGHMVSYKCKHILYMVSGTGGSQVGDVICTVVLYSE